MSMVNRGNSGVGKLESRVLHNIISSISRTLRPAAPAYHCLRLAEHLNSFPTAILTLTRQTTASRNYSCYNHVFVNTDISCNIWTFNIFRVAKRDFMPLIRIFEKNFLLIDLEEYQYSWFLCCFIYMNSLPSLLLREAL